MEHHAPPPNAHVAAPAHPLSAAHPLAGRVALVTGG
ncbi:short-chain dehydrogenase, partial [Desulfovibrio sp. XJ01]|nr:short-chain dehydrogenase [Nitratidesulfovibrio liaohensis]